MTSRPLGPYGPYGGYRGEAWQLQHRRSATPPPHHCFPTVINAQPPLRTINFSLSDCAVAMKAEPAEVGCHYRRPTLFTLTSQFSNNAA